MAVPSIIEASQKAVKPWMLSLVDEAFSGRLELSTWLRHCLILLESTCLSMKSRVCRFE